jgi:hypothetical protein
MDAAGRVSRSSCSSRCGERRPCWGDAGIAALRTRAFPHARCCARHIDSARHRLPREKNGRAPAGAPRSVTTPSGTRSARSGHRLHTGPMRHGTTGRPAGPPARAPALPRGARSGPPVQAGPCHSHGCDGRASPAAVPRLSRLGRASGDEARVRGRACRGVCRRHDRPRRDRRERDLLPAARARPARAWCSELARRSKHRGVTGTPMWWRPAIRATRTRSTRCVTRC